MGDTTGIKLANTGTSVSVSVWDNLNGKVLVTATSVSVAPATAAAAVVRAQSNSPTATNKESAAGRGNDSTTRYGSETKKALQLVNNLGGDGLIRRALFNGKSAKDSDIVTKAAFAKVMNSSTAAAEMDFAVFKGKDFISAKEAVTAIRNEGIKAQWINISPTEPTASTQSVTASDSTDIQSTAPTRYGNETKEALRRANNLGGDGLLKSALLNGKNARYEDRVTKADFARVMNNPTATSELSVAVFKGRSFISSREAVSAIRNEGIKAQWNNISPTDAASSTENATATGSTEIEVKIPTRYNDETQKALRLVNNSGGDVSIKVALLNGKNARYEDKVTQADFARVIISSTAAAALDFAVFKGKSFISSKEAVEAIRKEGINAQWNNISPTEQASVNENANGSESTGV